MASRSVILPAVVVLLGFTIQPSPAARVLVIPMFGGSHYFNLRQISEELGERGHEVSLLVASAVKYKPTNSINHIVYTVPFQAGHLEKDLVSDAFKNGNILTSRQGRNISNTYCRSMLSSAKQQKELFQEFDITVVDIAMTCSTIIASYFGTKLVVIAPLCLEAPFLKYFHVPMPVSYIPRVTSRCSDDMMVKTFSCRIRNTLIDAMYNFGNKLMHGYMMRRLSRELDMVPNETVTGFVGKAEMVLVTGHFALEYPQPIPPVKLVGPITVTKPNHLVPSLEEFVATSGPYGVIIVSFGSMVGSILERTQVDMLAQAFGNLNQKVMWRLKGYIPDNLSSNIRTVEWLPQNDLLADSRVKVFVSHCGHNSLYEAAYYGIPVVCVPLFSDQWDNSIKGEKAGMAVGLDIWTTTADEIYKTIDLVINDCSFQGNASRISRLMTDSTRTPRQQAADWIDYVLRHDVTHLRMEIANLHVLVSVLSCGCYSLSRRYSNIGYHSFYCYITVFV